MHFRDKIRGNEINHEKGESIMKRKEILKTFTAISLLTIAAGGAGPATAGELEREIRQEGRQEIRQEGRQEIRQERRQDEVGDEIRQEGRQELRQEGRQERRQLDRRL
jgi:hypothetical protein